MSVGAAAPGDVAAPGRRSAWRSLSTAPPWVSGLVGTLIIIVVWWLISAIFFGPEGAVPSPVNVVGELISDFGDRIYWKAVAATGSSALIGYLWGTLIGLVMAVIVLLLPLTEGVITQLAVVCSCIPLTAIGPIVTLMTPAGSRGTSIFLAGISVIFTTVVGAILGFRAASQTQLDVVSAYGGSRFTQLVKVRLIAALPAILAALKIGAPAAFLGAVLGEYFLSGVDSGVGIQLLAAQADNASVRLWALAITCGAIAGIAYAVIGLIGRLIAPWASGESGEQGVL